MRPPIDLKERQKTTMGKESNEAPEGTVWVCSACGKASKYRDRGTPDHKFLSRGWDVSCYMHAVLCSEDSVEIGPTGRVIKAIAWEEIQKLEISGKVVV
jgi:hypothetical protein